ncbi:hypothetical protein EI546_09500 [Aequorivita sp. H23M31]|uniref:TonB C-terminal domain-containing protein n=1 Tax=Aequorivita ciconiae TaxID=2494375 RepID=A0A410G3T8_9FLAO|nr:energy transducer TonB [Aequorivita sp. H23M31]QAA81942.1 hypothetical protein EI546_09500 [Aequorivita sp. H23M31]
MEANVKTPRNKREEKKQVNIKWNSTLFFQIGIIVSSLAIFFLMQTSFEIGSPENPKDSGYVLVDPPVIDYQLDIDLPKKVEPVKKTVVKPKTVVQPIKSTVTPVENDEKDVIETPVAPTDVPIEPTVKSIELPPAPEPSAPLSILNVEYVPVYPGCESLGTNAEKVECLSSQLNVFINRNFRKELLSEMGSNQIYRIYVQFKIDSKGFITDVKANSANEKLKNEAMRVVAKLPRMKPGRQGDKSVDVVYTVPISFRIP